MADLTRIAEIVGCQLFAGPNNTIQLTEGYFYLKNGRKLRSDGTATTQVPANAAVGWLHAYGVEAANNVAGLVLTPDAPVVYRGTARARGGAAPNESARYLGSGLVEATGRLRAGRHAVALSKGNMVGLDVGSSAFNTPQQLLNLGITLLQAPAQQSIALSGSIPPTATWVDMQINNMSNLTVYIGRPSMGTLSRNNRYCVVLPNNNLRFMMPLDADQTVTVLASTTGLLGGVISLSTGNVQAEVFGYLFDR